MMNHKNRARANTGLHNKTLALIPNVRVTALVHDIDQNKYALELKFRKVGGGSESLLVPRAALGRPGDVVKDLLNAGALLPNDPQSAVGFVTDALKQPPEHEVATTRRGGWHEQGFLGRGWTTVKSTKQLRLLANSSVDECLGLTSGDLESWLNGLREPCLNSDILTVGIGLPFAGALLELAGEDEGAILHLRGESSGGKSLTGRALQSVFGRARKSDLATFDITDRALEELCFARNDLAVVFDEEGRNKGSQHQRRERRRVIAFTVPSGRGMMRSVKAAQDSGLANLTWKLFALSSGETPLDDQPGDRRVAGEKVRHIDIEIPGRETGGIFNLVEGSPEKKRREAARLAALVEDTIADNHGVAIRVFAEKLAAQRDALKERIGNIVAAFIKHVHADTDAWERRFASKFGLIAAALILAAGFGVAPVDKEHAKRCVVRVYRLARRSALSVEERTASLLQRLREAVKDERRFPKVEKGDALPTNLKNQAWGFKRTDREHGAFIAIDPVQFREMIGSGPAAESVLEYLTSKQSVILGVGGKRRRQIAVQGFDRVGRSRWICLREQSF
ncbi:DUF927 domain-containing protein [Microvirga aerilata]|uniref:DUF927 domain-containing protein n=2 Tax=Microvirga aerilata TaxID=670292 RepID=A0A937D1R2_9HYPH|nr:DUF927 domain-containing protein [Microvirga aerilata]MBL0404415.1 DUF927 domain-containing protein [Microvirga aerilata]